jgi:hypothetical protein
MAARGSGPLARTAWAVFLAAGPLSWPAAAGAGGRRGNGPRPTVIDGPAAPAPPEVVARDEAGRVTLRAVRLDAPLDLDGRLDEAVYHDVPAASGFRQQVPREGQPATEPTEVWVLFDDDALYVAARCSDSQPRRIVANELRRDHYNIFQNDNFAVTLDTFYDRRTGYVFQTNPLGAMRDGAVSDERTSNYDWNTVWRTRSHRLESGWSVEMAIPFKSLRYPRSGAQLWGINFRRIVQSKNETSFFSLVPASYGSRGINKFSSSGTLVGVEVPSGSRRLELKPYSIVSLTTDRHAAEPHENDLGADAGLDLKYGITKGLTADVTLNTDFAQVEEDDQQVNLTRFNLLFPEKRDFFLEGQGIFAFGGSVQRASGPGSPPGGPGGGVSRQSITSLSPFLFFSRRIGLEGGQEVPIRAGARVTGRAGSYLIGALQIRTGDQPAANARATDFSVLRLRRDVFRSSSAGLIFTRRGPAAAGGGANLAYGADVNLLPVRDLTLVGYYARTRTPGVMARGADESSYRAQVEYVGDRYGFQFERLFVGERFNPEVGFLRRQAFRRSLGQLRFSPRPKASRLVRKWAVETSLDYIEDAHGRLETREMQGTFWLEMQSGDVCTFEATRYLDRPTREFPIGGVSIPAGDYRFQDVKGVLDLSVRRKVIGSVTLSHGSFYRGERTEAGYRGRIEVTPRLSVEPGVSINWLDLPQGALTTRLLTARTSFSISARAFVSALAQYNSTSNSLSGSVRLRWEYQPGSELFVVWSEGRDTLGRGFPGLANRTLVVKGTRLLRF